MPEVHKAFESSGKAEGLEVWRIENFEPVAVPKHQYGCFFSGDSYIVLKTTGSSTLSWDVHFWLGSSTSQDEAGAAAILSVNLDEGQFGGAAIQHRETQGHESRQFLGYFKPAIRYLDGGHASAFSHVTVNAGSTKRLFQVKGRRNVRLRQVPPEVSSMNKGDCFILDIDHDIYLYIGEKSNRMEKLNASMILNQLKDQDHHGRANVEIIDAYSHEGDEEKFFAALGSGDKDSIPDATEGGDDEEFDKGTPEDATLCEISDRTGEIKITKLNKPNRKAQLDTKECYVLDTGSSVYVWVGKNSNQKEKDAAFKRAEHYIKENNYPSWVHISKVPEGNEPAAFKKCFEDWN